MRQKVGTPGRAAVDSLVTGVRTAVAVAKRLPSRFPVWIALGAVALAAGYAPTLRAPFDFIDDGNLVYPAPPGTTLGGHVELWWQKVHANYEHLGPFRPTLWAHWEVFANVCGGEAKLWRAVRFVWCGLAAGMLLWLFRELKVHPVAALVAGAVAMWNPYRNEIWTSLTLGEGVAMPYALLALVAARKGAHAERPLAWDVVSILGVVTALGCKNTFVALIPAQVALRMFPDGLTLRDGWRRNGWRALALALTVVLPAVHFVYFKLNWHPGQYVPQKPSVEQFVRVLSSLKGAIGLDFLGAGLALALTCVVIQRAEHPSVAAGGLLAAPLLIAAGVVVYLPMDMMSGRYAMPGVWGLDVLIALLLTRLIQLPPSLWQKLAWVGIGIGVLLVLAANLIRQEKIAARSRLLWDVVHYLEQNAGPNAQVAWVSGDSTAGELNVEEGIHVRWHLLNRGRPDISIGLFDRDGKPLDRVELPPLAGEPTFRIAGGPGEGQTFREPYQLGRKVYECSVGRK
ncbi:hypothetical protein [Limnoglobus roseus]|uniref:Glycosyltransferase RgtA/B/C/D-like domain-containing protein n=1 Tax=Limnoglobus roseus TaxID=2598579 RepID=A0A5C1A4Z9_9BACT|nr:hypothetical protein [Limnoglobus roseus]QEL14189.1 hypothetical protein PX52LOC_01059 [Limnoglobus roseus]